jgi:RimJ/RimL family protein N-acetyltransferase
VTKHDREKKQNFMANIVKALLVPLILLGAAEAILVYFHWFGEESYYGAQLTKLGLLEKEGNTKIVEIDDMFLDPRTQEVKFEVNGQDYLVKVDLDSLRTYERPRGGSKIAVLVTYLPQDPKVSRAVYLAHAGDKAGQQTLTAALRREINSNAETEDKRKASSLFGIVLVAALGVLLSIMIGVSGLVRRAKAKASRAIGDIAWTGDVRLRDVIEDDLPIFFEHQSDPDANRMAAFPARSIDAFRTHWAKILGDKSLTVRTILLDGQVAGNIGCWEQDGKQLIGYWIGKEHWGKGVATKALSDLLGVVQARPLFACVAKHNIASIRVLEKCGFTIDAGETAAAGVPSDGIEELVFVLGTNY